MEATRTSEIPKTSANMCRASAIKARLPVIYPATISTARYIVNITTTIFNLLVSIDVSVLVMISFIIIWYLLNSVWRVNTDFDNAGHVDDRRITRIN